ncbi:hypothetical protein ARALYDRAFT_904181 [Arabidopsis lyrata subsp. lyrata]|uniref:Uncharacterized protein n=1 Tax=Arabidopsis lyrata subsp. lyrata TaxID=81972 RepID=D7LFY6_ARALL|nr:hypothetical protein ARALYDRAFT_904181 [Arabidopsis lyrata subsp. lyrata]
MFLTELSLGNAHARPRPKPQSLHPCDVRDTTRTSPGTYNKHNGVSSCQESCFNGGVKGSTYGTCVTLPKGKVCTCHNCKL